MSATRRDLAIALSKRSDLNQRQALAVVSELLDIMTDALGEQGRIELRGFGAFEVRKIKKQKTVDPRTGEPITIPATNTVDFKPGKDLREALASIKTKKARK